jgi:lysophospholipase L1-like esterase
MNESSSDTNKFNRRAFLKTSGFALGAAGVAGCVSVKDDHANEVWPPPAHALIAKDDVILFQGDSITDMGRSRDAAATPNNGAALGNGYASFAGLEALMDHSAARLKIFNRGVSGNKVYQLAERWQADCLDLKPNLLSILIGVNDIWHTLTGKYQGTVEIYERDYRALIERTLKALPELKLVICEPFVLRCGAVNDKWFPEFDHYRAAAARVANSYRAVFIPFQTMFNEAIQYAPPEYWAKDGVHPTPAGASLMAYYWLKAVGSKR